MNCEITLDALQQARRQARRKLGWYMHACVYVMVNLGLATLSLSHGRHWAAYPALGWGLGLAIHGLVVWRASFTNSFWQRMVERELRLLQKSESSH